MSPSQFLIAEKDPLAVPPVSGWPLAWALGLSFFLLVGQLLPASRFFANPSDFLAVHTGLEFLSLAVAAMVFALGWNLRRSGRNSHFALLAAAFLYVGLVDFAHIMSFQGMPDFVTPSGTEKAVFFWLAGRLGTVLGLLFVALSSPRRWSMRRCFAVIAGAVMAAALVLWVGLYHADSLPRTFIPGQGLTPIKIGLEFFLAGTHAIAAWILYRRGRRENSGSKQWLGVAAWTLALAELFFTMYADVTDVFNLLGHLYKAAAAWMIYRALFKTGVQAPLRALEQEGERLDRLVNERTVDLHAAATRFRESEAHFRATFEQAGVGVCHADISGRFLRVNDKYCAILGYGREELLGLKFQDITYPEDVEANLDGRAGLMEGKLQSYSMEKRYIRKDGAVVWINLTIALIRNAAGEPDYFLAVIEDIQERKEMEHALAKEREARHSLLAQEVAERTKELQAANRQLEGFLYAASHDLKGPLGRISSFSALLEKKYRDSLEGDGLLFLDFIRSNSTRLINLVDDLLSHARIDRQANLQQPVDVVVAVRKVLEESAEDIREAAAEVRMSLPQAWILADTHAVNQVLHNLLENALKYSSRVSRPVIDIGGEETDGRYRLWIKDNGVGFAMEYHDRIFDMFRRLHTYDEYSGSGVGLALVKRAMERVGGKVWAESAPGQGATFYLEFPVIDEVATA